MAQPCEICRKVVSLSHMRRHLDTHSTDRPHRCDQCDRAFARADRLNEHKRAVHSPVPRLQQALEEAQQRIAELEDQEEEDQERQQRRSAGVCVGCGLRGGVLHTCGKCRGRTHLFCARLWVMPADGGVLCEKCQERTERDLQTKHELSFLDAYLEVNGLTRVPVDGDGLCLLRCVADLVQEPLELVASKLLKHLATDLDVSDFGEPGIKAKAQAARQPSLEQLARRWDSDLMDFVPACVFAVYQRPLQVWAVRNRRVVIEWVPDAQRGHPNPLRVCHTGSAEKREHYDRISPC